MSYYSFSPHTPYSKPGSPNAQTCPERPEISTKNKHAAKKHVHNDNPGQDHVPGSIRSLTQCGEFGTQSLRIRNQNTNKRSCLSRLMPHPGKLDLGNITYGRASGRRTVSVRDEERHEAKISSSQTFRSPDCLIDFGHAPRVIELGALRLMAMLSG